MQFRSSKTIFPTHLDDWSEKKTSVIGVQAIGVVNLARLASAPSILPTALLLCAMLPGSDLVHGFSREGGSLEQLSPDDIALCLDAKSKILAMYISSSSHVFTLPQCGTPISCGEAARSALSDFQARIPKTPMLSPLRNVLSLLRPAVQKNICSHCRTAMITQAEESQNTAWSNLPSLFDIHIEGWPSAQLLPAPPPNRRQVCL